MIKIYLTCLQVSVVSPRVDVAECNLLNHFPLISKQYVGHKIPRPFTLFYAVRLSSRVVIMRACGKIQKWKIAYFLNLRSKSIKIGNCWGAPPPPAGGGGGGLS
jgi:hypothetical protein